MNPKIGVGFLSEKPFRAAMEEADAWKAELELEREQKDEFFVSDIGSPIPPARWRKFRGLVYFSAKPGYCLTLELKEHQDKRTVQVKDSKGNDRRYIRWGEFSFELNGQALALQAFKSDESEKRLFIPFKDSTSGNETYGAGRYLDLEEEQDFADGKWILDFNRAYNPWCAYSENFACPLVPPENWLQVPIKAGERAYQK